jgi:hypothetical protein
MAPRVLATRLALLPRFSLKILAGLCCLALSSAVAVAQQPQAPQPVSLGQLFAEPDGLELAPDARQKLRQAASQALNPSGCPYRARMTVTVKTGDPIFQPALADARRDVVKALLETMPTSVEVNSAVGSSSEVTVDYVRAQDTTAPKLQTTSIPSRGTKVCPGKIIEVTMTARDDQRRSDTGIQIIQLRSEGPGGDELIGAQDYRPVVRPNCERLPEPRTLKVSYTVPDPPPPVVRLRAITEDFANQNDFDVAEFPTQPKCEPETANAPQRRDNGNPRDTCVDRNIVRGMDFSFICK